MAAPSLYHATKGSASRHARQAKRVGLRLFQNAELPNNDHSHRATIYSGTNAISLAAAAFGGHHRSAFNTAVSQRPSVMRQRVPMIVLAVSGGRGRGSALPTAARLLMPAARAEHGAAVVPACSTGCEGGHREDRLAVEC